MKLVTWNVNSIRTRLERLGPFLKRHQPDVVCLQETKVVDEHFPSRELAELGYHCAVWGQRTYNGVAILSRQPPREVQIGFEGNPLPDQARLISADIEGIRVICVYVVNGKTIDSEHYQLKLSWLDALIGWLSRGWTPDRPLVITGDFNIAPSGEDTHDPEYWHDRNLCSDPERERLRRLLDWGLTDLHLHTGFGSDDKGRPNRFTWWDYRAGAFPKNHGLRIDLMLASAVVKDRCTDVTVDRNERRSTSGPGKPSDHAPVIATLSR